MIEFLYNFDRSLLSFYHLLAEHAGKLATPLMKFVTLIGEKGLWMLALALVLILFPKTRKAGVCLFGAVCCGALVTNFVLKDMIARARPFEADPEFRAWWVFIGAPAEDGFSFPSGHVTAAVAGVLALAMTVGRKVLWAGVPYVVIMGASRNYLMAHYPTDVLAACGVGVFAAVVAYGITILIFALLERFKDKKFCRAILYGLDARNLFRKISGKPPVQNGPEIKAVRPGEQTADEKEDDDGEDRLPL